MASVEPPKYEPKRWNKPGVQDATNCYDYAVDDLFDKKTPGHKAQPGKKHNKEAGHPYNCDNVKAAAVADGLSPTTKDAVCNYPCWKVALAIDPRDGNLNDYHWYRQDSSGNWSHKPDFGEATDKDADGKTMKDPETANRGRYTKFCSWFCVCRERVQIASAMPHSEKDGIVALALISSGRQDPHFTLRGEQLAVLSAKLSKLPPSRARQTPGLGYHGFLLLNPASVAGLPSVVRVQAGVITVTDANRHTKRYADTRQLEAWLLSIAARRPFGLALQTILAGEVPAQPANAPGGMKRKG
jgi:hypothetical protein